MTDLLKAFEIKEEKVNVETFKDKNLIDSLRVKIIERLVDFPKLENESNHEYINKNIEFVIDGYNLNTYERDYLFNLIENELESYGPLTRLMEDTEISEIMVNGVDDVYIEINGKLIKDDTVTFINDEHIIRTISRIIESVGRTINSTNPMVDARLKDGSRLNAIIPPLAIKGPVMTIRKFKKSIKEMDDLLRVGTMTPYMANFLDASVRGKLNILVCGGTGSGKTTLLNILSSSIPEGERLITIEDACELSLKQPHVISLETRNENYEHSGNVTIRDLVINSLRMRPDRIIVGEVRGEEAFDMLWAMNTGHEGSLTTLHANSARDALNRLESMVLMSSIDLPLHAIREYMARAIDLIVYEERLSDGTRKVLSISEINGINNGIVEVNDIFTFNVKGLTENGEVNGEFVRKEFVPNCLDKLHKKGIHDVDYIFE